MRIAILAEKFNVARDLAVALFGSVPPRSSSDAPFRGRAGYDDVSICWADGHIVQLAEPETYRADWGSPWRTEVLPLAPPEWKFRLEVTDHKRIHAIRTGFMGALEIVNACDAGREGELIFDEVARVLGVWPLKLKVSRMWIQDPLPAGLRQAFAGRAPADSKTYRLLRQAARLRAEADWIYNLSCTRAATIGLGKAFAGGRVASVGRVRTPLLAEISDKCARVEKFTPENFFQVVLIFQGSGGVFECKLKAPESAQWGRADCNWAAYDVARNAETDCLLASDGWIVGDEIKEPQGEYPPLPFTLLELQRSAARIMGWSAKKTSQVAQLLYQHYHAISYPRTDCPYLPPQTQTEMMERWDKLHASEWFQHRYPQASRLEIPRDNVDPFDKITDHHGIVPTGIIPPSFDEHNRMTDAFLLWELVAIRFLTAFLRPAVVHPATRRCQKSRPDGSAWEAYLSCATISDPAWLKFEELTIITRPRPRPLERRLQDKLFPPCGPTANVIRTRVPQLTSQGEDYHTYDTVLDWLEKVDLGTPATRAETIEDLIQLDYVRETGRHLKISPTGATLIDLLRTQGGKDLCMPEISAMWERLLGKIAKGAKDALPRDLFLDNLKLQVEELCTHLVSRAGIEKYVFCPKTGRIVTETAEGFVFGLAPNLVCPRVFHGREMKKSDYRDIFLGGESGGGPFEGFVSTKPDAVHKTFSAKVRFRNRERKFSLYFPSRQYIRRGT